MASNFDRLVELYVELFETKELLPPKPQELAQIEARLSAKQIEAAQNEALRRLGWYEEIEA